MNYDHELCIVHISSFVLGGIKSEKAKKRDEETRRNCLAFGANNASCSYYIGDNDLFYFKH
jgi:hypothetical protein